MESETSSGLLGQKLGPAQEDGADLNPAGAVGGRDQPEPRNPPDTPGGTQASGSGPRPRSGKNGASVLAGTMGTLMGTPWPPAAPAGPPMAESDDPARRDPAPAGPGTQVGEGGRGGKLGNHGGGKGGCSVWGVFGDFCAPNRARGRHVEHWDVRGSPRLHRALWGTRGEPWAAGRTSGVQR